MSNPNQAAPAPYKPTGKVAVLAERELPDGSKSRVVSDDIRVWKDVVPAKSSGK